MRIINQYRIVQADKQSGVSMIEMLVTLVIISIGLLGVAALQSRGQLATQGAYIVTQAVTQGYEIIDRMRVNSTIARDDVLAKGTGKGIGYISDSSPGGDVNACDAAACTPEQLRNYDLTQWYADIADTLPQGTGSITATVSATRVTYIITIQWIIKETERDAEDETGLRRQQWSLTL